MKDFLWIAVIIVGIVAVLAWWQVILGAVVVAGIGYALYAAFKGWLQLRNEANEQAAARMKRLAENADVEHQWALMGEPSGVYGNYPPVDLRNL